MRVSYCNVLQNYLDVFQINREIRFEKHFTVTFTGLDWGGLRREWFEAVSTQLFDPSMSGLFRHLSEDSQGLVCS